VTEIHDRVFTTPCPGALCRIDLMVRKRTDFSRGKDAPPAPPFGGGPRASARWLTARRNRRGSSRVTALRVAPSPRAAWECSIAGQRFESLHWLAARRGDDHLVLCAGSRGCAILGSQGVGSWRAISKRGEERVKYERMSGSDGFLAPLMDTEPTIDSLPPRACQAARSAP
jgi:hypothetical protein